MEREIPTCTAYLEHHNDRDESDGVWIEEAAGIGRVNMKTGTIENAGKKRKRGICGLPMERIPNSPEYWYCPSCDRRDSPEELPEEEAAGTV